MKNTIKILLIITVLSAGIFYYFKRDEINNLLDPGNTDIKVLNSHYRFGKLKIGDTLKHAFYVKNITSDKLSIKNVQTNCECIITDFTKESVKEGDSAKVLVQFIPNKIGEIRKDVLLEANTSPPFTVLSVSGEVVN